MILHNPDGVTYAQARQFIEGFRTFAPLDSDSWPRAFFDAKGKPREDVRPARGQWKGGILTLIYHDGLRTIGIEWWWDVGSEGGGRIMIFSVVSLRIEDGSLVARGSDPDFLDNSKPWHPIEVRLPILDMPQSPLRGQTTLEAFA